MSFDFEFEFGCKNRSTTRDWWQGLPTWFKLIFVFVSTPAWLLVAFCILTGQGKSTGGLVSFGILAATTALGIIVDRRSGH